MGNAEIGISKGEGLIEFPFSSFDEVKRGHGDDHFHDALERESLVFA